MNLLPEGLLPKWQLLVSSAALFNTAQCFITLSLTRRIYSGTPHQVNPLQSRTFAVWTWLSAVIRMTCAYHIHEKTIYVITIWSYVGAFVHFVSEWLILRSANFGAGLLGPLVVSSVSLTWMLMQYDYYVKA